MNGVCLIGGGLWGRANFKSVVCTVLTSKNFRYKFCYIKTQISHNESGKKVRVTISKLNKEKIGIINKSKRFHFNWNQEAKYEVYKLTAAGINDQALGLISIQERRSDYAIQIRLLASSKDSVGNGKKGGGKEYERIAGCLIAFACKESFRAGYDGYVCLKPKTDLEIHYQNAYGVIPTGMYLITEKENSLMLIKRYYEE